MAAPRPNHISDVHRFLGAHLGWLYLGSMSAFLVFALLLGFSSFGKRKLGPADSEPEFSRLTWFAMVLSAGTSVQFVYSAVADPLMQAAAPPFGRTGPQEVTLNAMSITLFHWSLHPWAVFAVVALCLAYASHRRGLPLKLSSAFYPALGERVHGRPGAVIDAIAILSTLLIVAATLVMSTPAITAGLHHLWHVPPGLTTQLGIILIVSCVATIAAASGLRQAMRRLSELNLAIVAGLLLFVLLAGQTLYLIANFADNLWAYLSYLPSNANELGLGANNTESRWLERWTVPYWAWWIAWAPAVGLFIAKISKGRTIRDVVVFVLIVPALVSSAWFATLGSAAFFEQAPRPRHDELCGLGKPGGRHLRTL
jgi:choline/glycine/proline betaine transport protein